jgi:hypothetical protein
VWAGFSGVHESRRLADGPLLTFGN